MIGQMLMMGFSGETIDEASEVVQWLKKDGLGGVLLFDYDLPAQKPGKNLIDKNQIRKLIHDLNDFSTRYSPDRDALPLLMAIDYEGGAVDRLAKIEGCRPTISPARQAELSDEAFEKESYQMAETIKSLGFNLDFAPVVDLNLNQSQGIIGRLDRSFSNDPSTVTRLSKAFVKYFNQKGILCAYKHFPGHGSAVGDSHEGFVDVTDSFSMDELLPYKCLKGEDHSNLMIMTAHVINRQLDESGLPATLSKKMLTGLLRETYGFNGIIISDDLQMKAIADHYSLEETLALTINAGADMLIVGNQLGRHSATDLVDRIESLVERKIIALGRIEEAFSRIKHLKKTIGVVKTETFA